jgi:hypothetical protein
MNPDKIYRQGFLRAVQIMKEAIREKKSLSPLAKKQLFDDLALLEQKAKVPMLTSMQGL